MNPNSGNHAPRLLDTLYRINQLASKNTDPAKAMEAILVLVSDYFGASSSTISLLNPDTGKLEIDVHHNMPEDVDEVALRPGQGVTGWVAFHGKPQLVPDVTADPRYIPIRPEVRSEMTAPLVQPNGQILGVINLDSDEIDGFSAEDMKTLVRLADDATAVLLRIWQLHHLEGKARQLENLVAVGQALVTKLQPEDLFRSITRDARKILNACGCALYLVNPTHQTVRMVSFSGEAESVSLNEEYPIESCLVSAVLHTRKPIEFSNIQSPDFMDVMDLPKNRELRSMLAVPMRYEKELLGMLAVFTKRIHRYNNDEKRLLSAIASLAAVSYQNSQLYARVFQSEESLRKNEQLTTLGLLAAEIAHEIRNPLTVIKLLFGYLDLDFPEDDQRRTDVRVIGEKLDQLEAIVTRVLSFAKTPTSLHSRWSVTDIIEDTIVLIRLKLSQSRIQLHFSPPTAPLMVDVHKGQIQQVLLNLLINATQAMVEGGEIVVYTHTPEKDPGYVAIDVKDTGPGIPEELRDRIFDSFLSGKTDGTGLGLAIAKRIMVSHHGDINLLETGQGGTTLRIRLPLCHNH